MPREYLTAWKQKIEKSLRGTPLTRDLDVVRVLELDTARGVGDGVSVEVVAGRAAVADPFGRRVGPLVRVEAVVRAIVEGVVVDHVVGRAEAHADAVPHAVDVVVVDLGVHRLQEGDPGVLCIYCFYSSSCVRG